MSRNPTYVQERMRLEEVVKMEIRARQQSTESLKEMVEQGVAKVRRGSGVGGRAHVHWKGMQQGTGMHKVGESGRGGAPRLGGCFQ